MQFNAAVRVLSLLIVIEIIGLTTPSQAINFTLSVGLAHCLLAYIYGRKRIAESFSSLRTAIPSLSVICLSVALFYSNFSVYVIFGIHHIFNEVYTAQYPSSPQAASKLRLFRLFATTFAYFFAIRRTFGILLDVTNVLAFGLLLSAISYVVALLLVRPRISTADAFRFLIFESIGLVPVAFSLFVPVQATYFVLYHFIFWNFFPLRSMLTHSRSRAIIFFAGHLIATFVFWAVSPLGLAPVCDWPTWVSVFTLNSFLHILTSLAWSDAHPLWIRRIFKSSPAQSLTTVSTAITPALANTRS